MKKFLIPLLVVILAFAGVANASAQDLPYYFQVNKEVVHVYWNSDGTQSLGYTWVFTNQAGSHPIDFVDVGMPSYDFDTGAIKADVDGVPVSISSSDYAGNGSGFAVVMGNKTIPAGSSGTVHVYVGAISGVLYPDDNDEAYASATFAPSYFGSQYITGNTDFTLTYHLPPNMGEQEPRWHSSPSGFPSEPQAAYDANNRITYTWYSSSASASDYYLFGASFPRTYVPAESIYVKPAEPLISGDTIFNLLCGGFFLFLFVGIPALTAVSGQRRKMQYMPPKVSVEGHGIKRGLTAVEAAILMEQPLDKIMTMILFGVIKKDAAEVVTRDPLTIKSAPILSDGLHEYELNFLRAFKVDNTKERQAALQETMVKLVKSVSEKMRGFSRKETLDYYKSIMEKAWQQIEAADTPEVKSQKFDEALEWTMLDKDYDDRTRRVGPVFLPMWWGRFDPTTSSRPIQTGSGFPSSVPSQPTSMGRSALPGADIAAQMVTGVQTFSQKVVGNLNTFTERVTGATNPLPKPTASGKSRSGGGGGGRSCACACACAGCACACAGGGR
jgi:hypothetical protein